MHYAVAAEAVREEEAGHGGHRAKNAVMIGRHLIQSRPGAFGIDWKILKGWDAVGGVHQDLLDKRRFEVSLITRRFLGIVPCQQKAAAFRTEVEAGAHIDDHG